MPRNKISDLNDHLFEQIEKLGDDSLSDAELKKEIERSKAMHLVASNIIDIAKTTIDAMRLVSKGEIVRGDLPLLLSDNNQS